MSSNTNTLSTTNQATDMWYNEVITPGYDFDNQGFDSGTGHFTQVVWKGSTKLGCGISGVYVVCRYCETAGNMGGAFETNVFPKKAAEETPAETTAEETPAEESAAVIPESADYNSAYNTLALTAHNKYRVEHQVPELIFDASAAQSA